MTTADNTKAVPAPRPYLQIVNALSLPAVVLPQQGKHKTKPASRTGPRVACNDEVIPESSRNNTLMSLAGTMRRKGMTEPAIEAALQAENKARCKPPLPEDEVSAIATSVMRYDPSHDDGVRKTLNDAGNADRFASRFRDDVKYVPGLGWFAWNGLHWERDGIGKIMEHAKAIARSIYDEGVAVADNDLRVAIAHHAKSSHQAARLKAMVELAQSLPELVIEPGKLDADDLLLGVANGVIDLRTGKLRASTREDLLTRHTPVAYDKPAECPQFLAFLDQITCGDRLLAKYLQRLLGYCLSGLTREQCLFFFYGLGANGKSTFLNTIQDLLGPALALQTPSETLMVKRGTATNDLARLQSVRVVVANEIEDGSLLAESLVKQMTGGDPITARFHYQEFFEFRPKFKLCIAGNHKPTIRGRDNGIWRRIRLIPFQASIPPAQQDQSLQQKLRGELPGILNWALAGCKGYLKHGLQEPASVVTAGAAYKEEMDVINQWLDACATISVTAEWPAASAYQSYKTWCDNNGYRPLASGMFGREFADRFGKVKRKDGNYYLGVKGR